MSQTINHYPWRRKRSYKGLALKPAQIVDTSSLSPDYFSVSNIPTDLTAGKNMLKIAGTQNLDKYSEIQIEVLDQFGKTIYWELDDWVDFAQNRVITIWIYPETQPGPAKITLLGVASTGAIVKWETIVNVDPDSPNSTPILFSDKPTILVEEVFRTMYKPTWVGDKVVSQSISSVTTIQYDYSGKPGFDNYSSSLADNLDTNKNASKLFANNTQNNTIWTTWNQNAITTNKGYKGFSGYNKELPAFKNTVFKQNKTDISTQQGVTLRLNHSGGSGLEFRKEHEGGTLNIHSMTQVVPENSTVGTYTTTVTRVLNENTVLVTNKFKDSNGVDIKSFKEGQFSITHSAPPTTYSQSQAYENFASFKVHNLEPMTGDIFRLRVSARQHDSTNNEFEVIANKILEGGNILVDKNVPPFTVPMGEFVSSSIISTYWTASSFTDLNPSSFFYNLAPNSSPFRASCSWDNSDISEGMRIGGDLAGTALSRGIHKIQPISGSCTTASFTVQFAEGTTALRPILGLTSSDGTTETFELTSAGIATNGERNGSGHIWVSIYNVTTDISGISANFKEAVEDSDGILDSNLYGKVFVQTESIAQGLAIVQQIVPGTIGNTPVTDVADGGTTWNNFYTFTYPNADQSFGSGTGLAGCEGEPFSMDVFKDCRYGIGLGTLYAKVAHGAAASLYSSKIHIAISGSAIDNDVTNLNTQYVYDSADFKGRILETIAPKDIIGTTAVDSNGYINYRLDDLDITFTADNTGTATPVFIIEQGGRWSLSDFTLGGKEETGFNPNYVELEVPIAPKFDGSNLDFKFEYFDYLGNASKDVTYLNNVYFSNGKPTFVQGKFNLVTGSLFVGDVIGKGIEQSGKNSGFVRSVGYGGWGEATSSTGPPGFLLFSGSVGLGAASNDYKGVGIEMAAGTDYFKFRTNPSQLEIRSENVFFSGSNVEINTPNFFLGQENGPFISGSNASGQAVIQISSSMFNVDTKGAITASSALFQNRAQADLFTYNELIVDGRLSSGRANYILEAYDEPGSDRKYCALNLTGSSEFGGPDTGHFIRIVSMSGDYNNMGTFAYPIGAINIAGGRAQTPVSWVMIENAGFPAGTEDPIYFALSKEGEPGGPSSAYRATDIYAEPTSLFYKSFNKGATIDGEVYDNLLQLKSGDRLLLYKSQHDWRIQSISQFGESAPYFYSGSHQNSPVYINNLPTADPGGTEQLYTQTADQLGGSGTTKVICIT